jgi:acyl-coenzyme A thioesterase PaaI-like protein
MNSKAFQDYYPDHLSHCYGCGKLNEHGYQIKTVWDNDETLTTFTPKPFHTAVPGFVYGGLLASLIDCHATGSAAAAMYKKDGREMDTEPSYRFLTGSLFVKYIKPTPIDCTLQIRGRIKDISGKKVTVEVDLIAKGVITVKGEVVAVQVPDRYIEDIIKMATPKTD